MPPNSISHTQDIRKAMLPGYVCVSECTWRSRNVNFQGAKNCEGFASSAHRRQQGLSGGGQCVQLKKDCITTQYVQYYTIRSVTGHAMLQDMLCTVLLQWQDKLRTVHASRTWAASGIKESFWSFRSLRLDVLQNGMNYLNLRRIRIGITWSYKTQSSIFSNVPNFLELVDL